MNDTVAILTIAKARIADPAHWTQFYYARNAKGTPTSELDQGAAQWCALGSLLGLGRGRGLQVQEAEICLNLAVQEISGKPSMLLSVFNDSHKHEDVIKAFDLAIKIAKGEHKKLPEDLKCRSTASPQ